MRCGITGKKSRGEKMYGYTAEEINNAKTIGLYDEILLNATK